LAAKVLTQFKQKIASLELVPSTGGCFEINVDGQLIYSKLASGQFPSEEVITEEVGKRLKK